MATFLSGGVIVGVGALLAQPFRAWDRASKKRELRSHQEWVAQIAPLPLSVTDLAPAILHLQSQDTPKVREYGDELKWYAFRYHMDGADPLFVEFLAESETAPILEVHIGLKWKWQLRGGKLDPRCVDQIIAVLDATVVIPPQDLEKIRKTVTKIPEGNWNFKLGIISLQVVLSDFRHRNVLLIRREGG
jgi:hypothetical protein